MTQNQSSYIIDEALKRRGVDLEATTFSVMYSEIASALADTIEYDVLEKMSDSDIASIADKVVEQLPQAVNWHDFVSDIVYVTDEYQNTLELGELDEDEDDGDRDDSVELGYIYDAYEFEEDDDDEDTDEDEYIEDDDEDDDDGDDDE